MNIEDFEKFIKDKVVGIPITHMWRGYGSSIFFEIGNLSQPVELDDTGQPEGKMSIGVEGNWRIEIGNSIDAGSGDHIQILDEVLYSLSGCSISDITLFGSIPELEIIISNNCRFLSFSTTRGQPEWYIVDRTTDCERWISIKNGVLHVGDGNEQDE